MGSNGGQRRWMLDEETDHCLSCNTLFDGVLCRKHHCRRCGGIYCDDCSGSKHLIHPAEVVYPPDWDSVLSSFDPREPLRACSSCRRVLLPQQSTLRRTTSNAAQPTKVERSNAERYMNIPIQFEMASEIVKATHTLMNFCDDNAIEGQDTVPKELIAGAWGLAFITTMQAGFFFSGRIGSGLVISRTADGGWSAPSAVCTTGAGWGLQIGGEVTDMLVILNSQDAVDAFASTAQLSLGTELSLALGPLGRSAETNMTAGDNGVSAVFSYAHSKGFFVGIALQACVILARPDCNERFYGESYDVATILSGAIDRPAAADPLYKALEEVIAGYESEWDNVQHSAEFKKQGFPDDDEDPFASDPFAPQSDPFVPPSGDPFAGSVQAKVLDAVEQEQIDADLALALALSEEDAEHAAAIDNAAHYNEQQQQQQREAPAASSSWWSSTPPPPPPREEEDPEDRWAADRRLRLERSAEPSSALAEELLRVNLDASRRPSPSDDAVYAEEDSAITGL